MNRPLDFASLSDEELAAKREALAEELNPLWMRLEAIDDELMHRHRQRRRERILTPPLERAAGLPNELEPVEV